MNCIAASFVVLIQILFTLKSASIGGKFGIYAQEVHKQYGNVKIFGYELFNNYLVPFEIVSVMLLVAMIGAIILAKKD